VASGLMEKINKSSSPATGCEEGVAWLQAGEQAGEQEKAGEINRVARLQGAKRE
jgi:hypothetical protein